MTEHARKRIVLIEDDPDIARLLRLELDEAGFDLEAFERGATGLTAVREHPPDLVVLDLGLPDMDGAEIARRIRRTEALPIIVLTARDEVESKVALLGDGADDYVPKPFHVEELVVRIQVQLRKRHVGEVRQVGALTVDVLQRQVRWHEREVSLSPREFSLVMLLTSHPGRVFGREEIERQVWSETPNPSSNVVDVHVANLRGKLRSAGAHGLIRTVRGVGYAIKASA